MKKNDSSQKLKLLGEGGQGLVLLSKILGEIFTEELGYSISIKTTYDSAVRKGEVDIDLIASKNKISNPIINKADLCLLLRKTENLPDSIVYVVEKSIVKKLKVPENRAKTVDFIKISKEKSLTNKLNMIILGWVIRKLDIGLLPNDIDKFLPEINRKSNFEAVKIGFDI